MFADNSLSFNTNWSTTQAITTTADSATIIDITGAGAGNAPAMINGYNAANTAMELDMGQAGDGVATPWVVVCVVVAPTSTTNTLTVALKGAPDNGSYAEGTYDIYGQTDAMAGALLLAGSIIMFPVPPRKIGKSLPRFYKLTYTASATLTAMTVKAGIVINPPSWVNYAPQIQNNFQAV